MDNDDTKEAKACRSVKIEDEHGASITISETLDRKHLAISTRGAPKSKGGDGDPRVFLNQAQIDVLRLAAGYHLDIETPKPAAEPNVQVKVTPSTETEEAF